MGVMNSDVREKLCGILAQYGRAVCKDPRRLRALLNDLCPGNQRELHVLLEALRQRVPHELVSRSKSLPPDTVAARLAKGLVDDLALTPEAARWAVDSWMLALGLVPMPQPAKPLPGTPDLAHVRANANNPTQLPSVTSPARLATEGSRPATPQSTSPQTAPSSATPGKLILLVVAGSVVALGMISLLREWGVTRTPEMVPGTPAEWTIRARQVIGIDKYPDSSTHLQYQEVAKRLYRHWRTQERTVKGSVLSKDQVGRDVRNLKKDDKKPGSGPTISDFDFYYDAFLTPLDPGRYPDGTLSPQAERQAIELYDVVMGRIDPDLCYSTIPKLDELYDGELPEEHVARLKRYKEDFEQCETALAELVQEAIARLHVKYLRELEAYVARQGWRRFWSKIVVDGVPLGMWVQEVRAEKKRTGLKDHPWLAEKLEAIPGWKW